MGIIDSENLKEEEEVQLPKRDIVEHKISTHILLYKEFQGIKRKKNPECFKNHKAFNSKKLIF